MARERMADGGGRMASAPLWLVAIRVHGPATNGQMAISILHRNIGLVKAHRRSTFPSPGRCGSATCALWPLPGRTVPSKPDPGLPTRAGLSLLEPPTDPRVTGSGRAGVAVAVAAPAPAPAPAPVQLRRRTSGRSRAGAECNPREARREQERRARLGHE
ncbi:unnamed protein product, partial [Diplocarpon coronariae]